MKYYDDFILQTGLIEGDFSDEAREVLVDQAEAFLRGGGVVSFDHWKTWNPDTRAAFIKAKQKIDMEQLGLLLMSLKALLHPSEEEANEITDDGLDKILQEKMKRVEE